MRRWAGYKGGLVCAQGLGRVLTAVCKGEAGLCIGPLAVYKAVGWSVYKVVGCVQGRGWAVYEALGWA